MHSPLLAKEAEVVRVASAGEASLPELRIVPYGTTELACRRPRRVGGAVVASRGFVGFAKAAARSCWTRGPLLDLFAILEVPYDV